MTSVCKISSIFSSWNKINFIQYKTFESCWYFHLLYGILISPPSLISSGKLVIFQYSAYMFGHFQLGFLFSDEA